MDVWILLAGPEVVSGASQGFSDVEEMGSIRVREQSCLILLQRAKLLNIPDVPPNPRLQPVQRRPQEPSNRHPRTKSRAWISDLMQHELIPKAFFFYKENSKLT